MSWIVVTSLVGSAVWLGCSSGNSPVPDSAPGAAGLAEWVQENREPVSGSALRNDDSDLDWLAGIAEQAQIIGLGEAGHSQHDFLMMRNRVFLRLIDEGVSAIVLESGAVESELPNRFINGDEALSPLELHQNGFTYFKGFDIDNVALLLHLRHENANRANSPHRVALYGMDQPAGSADLVVPTKRALELIRAKRPRTPSAAWKELDARWNALESLVAAATPAAPTNPRFDQQAQFSRTSSSDRRKLSLTIALLIAQATPELDLSEPPEHKGDAGEFQERLDRALVYFRGQIPLMVEFISEPKAIEGAHGVPDGHTERDPPTASEATRKLAELIDELAALSRERAAGELAQDKKDRLTVRLEELMTWVELFRVDFPDDYRSRYDDLRRAQQLDFIGRKLPLESTWPGQANAANLDLLLLRAATVARQTYRQLYVADWLGVVHPVSARVREASMAENVDWVLRVEAERLANSERPPKLAVFAHNTHIAKQKREHHRSVGTYLAERHRSRFKSIQMTARAFEFNSALPPVTAGSIEYELRDAQSEASKNFFIDLDSPTMTEEARLVLAKSLRYVVGRALAPGQEPAQAQSEDVRFVHRYRTISYLDQSNPNYNAFNGILYLDRVTRAATLLDIFSSGGRAAADGTPPHRRAIEKYVVPGEYGTQYGGSEASETLYDKLVRYMDALASALQ